MFKFTKAQTAADTDGSESKDTSEKVRKQEAEKYVHSGQRSQECTYQKRKRRTKPGTDLEALNRQGASLSRHAESLGKQHPNTLNRTRMGPETSDEAFQIGSRMSTKTE